MNRRQFGIGLAASIATLPLLKASATHLDVLESPIMPMFRMMPDRPGPDGIDFPVTTGVNQWLQRQVGPENPDMYWDPVGEDYGQLFGFYPNTKLLSSSQGDVELWNLDLEYYTIDTTIGILQSNGWEAVENTWPLLHYSASTKEQKSLVESLNTLGHDIVSGRFDWIAFPDDTSMVVGMNEELVRTVATYSDMTTIDTRFHGLRNVLPVNAYIAAVQPAQTLSLQGASSTFISKSWTSNIPIISSVGVHLDSPDAVDPFIETVHSRLKTGSSSILDLPYSEFIEIGDIQIEYSSVRIDFIPNTLDWDIFLAVQNSDFGMLPPA